MGLGLVFDNICVAIGVILLWIWNGQKADLGREMRKAGEGGFGDNWFEALVGLVALLVICASMWFIHFFWISK